MLQLLLVTTKVRGNPPKNSLTLGPPALQLLDPNQVKFAKLQEEIQALSNVLSHSSFANTSEYFSRCMSITLTFVPSSEPYWILDSRATDHMTANKSLLDNFSSSTIKKGVITAGSHTLPVYAVGQVKFGNIGTFYNVLYVPHLTAN